MKKIIIVFTTALLLIGITGCFSKMETYDEISLEKFYDKMDNKDSFILVIGSHDCSHCQTFKPKMEAVIKVNQIKVYYIDLANLTDKENKEFSNSINYAGTPTTVFIEKGEEKSTSNRIEGDKDIDYIEMKFKKNGYIK